MVTKEMSRVLLAASLLWAAGCITPDAVQGALNDMGQRAVNDSANAAYDAGREAVKNRKDRGGACEGARDGAASADKGCGEEKK
jgi:hypothetical protein